MTDLTTVSAVAIVKARDGSSIEDWEEDSGVSADHYLADPDRILAAVRGLEDAGLSVRGISEVTITFSGTAELMSATFGETINTDDLVHPSWSGAGGTVRPVPAGHHLSAQLSSVRLESAPSPDQRINGTELAEETQVTPLDLLVGEVGQTLGSTESLPKRFNEKKPRFPLSEIDKSTRKSIAEWAKILTRRMPIFQQSQNTWINVDELHAGTSAIPTMLDRYSIRGNPELDLHSLYADPRDIYRTESLWKKYQGQMAEAVLEWLVPAVRRASFAVDKVDHVIQEAAKAPLKKRKLNDKRLAGAVEKLLVATINVASRLKYLMAKKGFGRWIRDGQILRWEASENGQGSKSFSLHKDGRYFEREDLSKFDADALEANARELKKVYDSSQKADKRDRKLARAADLNQEIKRSLDGLNKTKLAFLAQGMLQDRLNAVEEANKHALMVAFAVNGVTLGLVRARVWGGRKISDPYLRRSESGSAEEQSKPRLFPNNIVSGSWGISQTTVDDWPKAFKEFRRELGSALSDRRTLHVRSAGNKGQERPTQSALLSGADNVILVGGCEPYLEDNLPLWKASNETHGYGLRIKTDKLQIPDLCASTRGDSGGSIIFPFPALVQDSDEGFNLVANSISDLTNDTVSRDEVPTWYTGSGSSQSCPIVAAVAGLVWSCFPELSAPQLKSLLLISSQPLDSGEFHLPSDLTADEQQRVVFKNSNKDDRWQEEGRRRVDLWETLAAAQMQTKNHLRSGFHRFVNSKTKRRR